MGKLILCSGARTKIPYIFTQTGIRIYTMEELCYYLYHNVYIIEEDMFCDSLFDFIDTQLKLKERADKLRILKKQKSDIKTMVTVLLCSTDYFTEYEIKSVLKLLDEIIGMPMVKRNVIKAGCYLKAGQYSKAATEYIKIINSREAAQLTPEEYGDLYHNLAVAKVHITGLKEASKLFGQAYERNHREESLKQYLYTLLLCNNKTVYQDKAEELEISPEINERIREFLQKAEKAAEDSKMMKEVRQLSEMKAQGKMSEFYHAVNEMIEEWKDKVRQS